MAKSITAKQNELQKKLKTHEVTLEKIRQLQEQADAEAAAIKKVEDEIAALRQAEQEKKLTAMAFGQGYNSDNLEAIMPELAMLFDPKTQTAALEALAAVRARAESAENSGATDITEKTEG